MVFVLFEKQSTLIHLEKCLNDFHDQVEIQNASFSPPPTSDQFTFANVWTPDDLALRGAAAHWLHSKAYLAGFILNEWNLEVSGLFRFSRRWFSLSMITYLAILISPNSRRGLLLLFEYHSVLHLVLSILSCKFPNVSDTSVSQSA